MTNALEHLLEALKIHRKIGYRQGEAADLGSIGLVYQARGDLGSALENQEALNVYRKRLLQEENQL